MSTHFDDDKYEADLARKQMAISPKDLEIEYPQKDNIKGEHLRFICDITHIPTGMRCRGRGPNSEAAKQAAMRELMLTLDGH